MKELKKGDVVKIYEDPITRQIFEGSARLIDQVRPDVGDGLEMWTVVFAGDTQLSWRAIYNGYGSSLHMQG